MDPFREMEIKYERRFAEMQYHILTLQREVDELKKISASQSSGDTTAFHTSSQKQERTPQSFPVLGKIDGRLWIIPDYNDGYLAVFGLKACLTLKDDILKRIGFKFSRTLDFGAGWIAENSTLNILMEEISKRNEDFPVKIESKVLRRADALAFKLT